MVASGIILLALVSLLSITVIGLVDISMARQRQGASTLANQVLEQLRSFPSATLAAGMNSTDLANSLSGGSTPDSAISQSGGNYYFEGEQVPATGATQLPPLNPHRSTKTVGVSPYTVSTYLTYYQNNVTTSTPIYRATVVVTWTRSARQGVASSVRVQSLLYPPTGTGCASSSTHQYTAPCQAFFYALATSGQGLVSVTGTVAGLNGFTGINVDTPKTEAALQSEQLSHAEATALTSGDYLTATSSQSSGGQQAATVAATNDPAQPSYYNTASVVGPGALTLADAAGLNAISVTSSGIDTATATATTSAGQPVTYMCNNASGVAQTDGLGCANAQVRQLQPQSVSVTVSPAGIGFATAQLLSVGAQPAVVPSPQIAYAKRDAAASGSCAGDGCTDAKQTRSLGTVQLGAFPSGFTPPVGWLGYLVQVTSYSDSVFAQSGVSPAATTATASGTISYWNGTGYQSIAYSGTSVSIPAVSVSATGLVNGSLLMATLSASNLVTGGTSTSTTTSGCGTGNVCAASAKSASPVIGDVNFAIGLSAGGVITTTLASLDAHIDLGAIQAQTSYTPAP